MVHETCLCYNNLKEAETKIERLAMVACFGLLPLERGPSVPLGFSPIAFIDFINIPLNGIVSM